jgi:hypothetical protein
MKDKIKKFFKDHEDEFAIAQTIAGGAAIVMGVVGLYKIRGLQIDGVFSCAEEACTDHIFVVLKNGTESAWTKPEL